MSIGNRVYVLSENLCDHKLTSDSSNDPSLRKVSNTNDKFI